MTFLKNLVESRNFYVLHIFRQFLATFGTSYICLYICFKKTNLNLEAFGTLCVRLYFSKKIKQFSGLSGPHMYHTTFFKKPD